MAEKKNAATKPQQTQKETEGRKQDLSDFVLGPFRDWYDYIRVNAREYYLGLLKINLAAFAVTVLSYLILAAIAGGLLIFMVGMDSLASPGAVVLKLLGNLALLAVALLAVLILLAIAEWLSKSIALTSVLYTDSQFEKKPFGIVEAFHKIKWPVLRFTILDLIISAVIFAPAAVLAVVAYGGALAALFGTIATAGASGAIWGIIAMLLAITIGYLVIFSYVFIVSTIYGFLAQFWAYGFLLGGMGVVDALKRSVGIIRKRFWETAAFYVVLGFAALAASIPLMIYGLGANFVLRLIQFFAEADRGLLIWGVYLIALLINSLITLVISTAVEAFRLPIHYLFWKKVKDA